MDCCCGLSFITVFIIHVLFVECSGKPVSDEDKFSEDMMETFKGGYDSPMMKPEVPRDVRHTGQLFGFDFKPLIEPRTQKRLSGQERFQEAHRLGRSKVHVSRNKYEFCSSREECLRLRNEIRRIQRQKKSEQAILRPDQEIHRQKRL